MPQHSRLTVKLHISNVTLPLLRDILHPGATEIALQVDFSSNFPFSPPFIQIGLPQIISSFPSDGAVCFELLTRSGWRASALMKPIFHQIWRAIQSTIPLEVRLHSAVRHVASCGGEWMKRQAVKGFKSVCQVNRDDISKNIDKLQQDEGFNRGKQDHNRTFKIAMEFYGGYGRYRIGVGVALTKIGW